MTINNATIFVTSTDELQTITKRYKTSQEVYDEISEIKKKQNKLKRLSKQFFKQNIS